MEMNLKLNDVKDAIDNTSNLITPSVSK